MLGILKKINKIRFYIKKGPVIMCSGRKTISRRKNPLKLFLPIMKLDYQIKSNKVIEVLDGLRTLAFGYIKP